jgi:hypothetical protein
MTTKESEVTIPGLRLLNLCRSTSVTGFLVCLVFCSALLQITVLARHWVSLEALLAEFATTSISVSGS